jgi:hypothetical protein
MKESLYGLTVQNYRLMFNFMAMITCRLSQACEIGKEVGQKKNEYEVTY